jgi:hypothetical protein
MFDTRYFSYIKDKSLLGIPSLLFITFAYYNSVFCLPEAFIINPSTSYYVYLSWCFIITFLILSDFRSEYDVRDTTDFIIFFIFGFCSIVFIFYLKIIAKTMEINDLKLTFLY